MPPREIPKWSILNLSRSNSQSALKWEVGSWEDGVRTTRTRLPSRSQVTELCQIIMYMKPGELWLLEPVKAYKASIGGNVTRAVEMRDDGRAGARRRSKSNAAVSYYDFWVDFRSLHDQGS